jgi:cytosine/uracil/thiamine/allantoin permease
MWCANAAALVALPLGAAGALALADPTALAARPGVVWAVDAGWLVSGLAAAALAWHLREQAASERAAAAPPADGAATTATAGGPAA